MSVWEIYKVVKFSKAKSSIISGFFWFILIAMIVGKFGKDIFWNSLKAWC